MRNSLSGEILHRPQMVEWEIRIIKSDGMLQEEVEQYVGVHECTEEDYKKLVKNKLKKFRRDSLPGRTQKRKNRSRSSSGRTGSRSSKSRS